MKHLLCFGFGFSAKTLAQKLDAKDWKITGTSRTAEGAAKITAMGFTGVRFDDLEIIPDDVTHIISSVPPGNSDPVLDRFADQISKLKLIYVAYLSTTGVYGNHDSQWTDENTELTPNTERGRKRLQAETRWLELLHKHGTPVHIFRLAGIYGPGRNQLETVKAGTAKRVIKQGQVFSRIHVEDIAGLLLASMAKPNPGRAYNGADDEPAPPQDVVQYAAELLGLPVPPAIPFEQAELSPMARSFYEDSKKVSNSRAKTELGYSFKYPNYREGLKALLKP